MNSVSLLLYGCQHGGMGEINPYLNMGEWGEISPYLNMGEWGKSIPTSTWGNGGNQSLPQHGGMEQIGPYLVDRSDGSGVRGTGLLGLLWVVDPHQSVSSDQLLHGGATLSQRPGTLPFRNVHPAVLF